MNIYYPKDHYNKNYRSHVFPLLKPFLKNEGFTNEERVQLYGISDEDIGIVSQIKDADVVVLPMSWNYYTLTKTIAKAKSLIEEASQCGKTVWCILSGDLGVDVPKLENCMFFRPSGARSKLTVYHRGLPVFINDPLRTNFNSDTVFEREFDSLPTVGFCGLADSSKTNAAIGIAKIAVRNLCYYLKLSSSTPEALISAPYFRYNCLNEIKLSTKIKDNFIIRTKYRAGATTKLMRKESTRDFYNNIVESDYILCVRGAGNFSVRLYETLAMGRIPVFVNTDCLLPLDNRIDWRKHTVWVEQNELHLLEEKILEFHNKLNKATLNELFVNNRKLWLTSLTLKGFFNHI